MNRRSFMNRREMERFMLRPQSIYLACSIIFLAIWPIAGDSQFLGAAAIMAIGALVATRIFP
jgi:hypothetical protein